MKVAPFAQPFRFALVGAPELELHFPSRCRWATARFVAVEHGRWRAAVDEAVALAPDVVVIADPHELPPAELARLPGVKACWVTRPLPSSEDAAHLRAACEASAGGARFDLLAWHEEPPDEAAGLPLLQVLPPPVDAARCLPAPRLDVRRVLVPAWARPPRGCLARLRRNADVAEIPLDAPTASWPDILASGGALAYWSHAQLGRLDPLPLLALANGLLLISNVPFPEPWGIEQEDEYLMRRSEDQMACAVEDTLRLPDATRAVRARAFQKVREAFDAEAAFHRLAHDALLFTQAGERQAGPAPAEQRRA